jgi:cobalt-zinc-cadmium resistance protein CzcA
VGGFKGWQIGISIPLWFLPQSAKTTQARANALIARNEANYQQYNVAMHINELQLKLNKYFERLNYFYNGALKQADALENTANAQFNADAIDYIEYLQSTTQAMSIKLDYLETIYNYNKVAIELEVYSY